MDNIYSLFNYNTSTEISYYLYNKLVKERFMDNSMKKKITIIILMIVVLVGGLIFWNFKA